MLRRALSARLEARTTSMQSIFASQQMPKRVGTAFLILPGVGWLTVFMLVPCAIVFFFSFFERGVYGGTDYVFTLENFARAAEPVYLKVFLASARIAALATLVALVALVALLIGYSAASAISLAPRAHQTRYLFSSCCRSGATT